MKLKMKFYTFCTIILLVQLSKSEINKSLRHYDVIKKEQFIHNIVKRGASDSDHKFNKIREIDFHALGKNFRLILSPKKSLFSGNFKVRTKHKTKCNHQSGRHQSSPFISA